MACSVEGDATVDGEVLSRHEVGAVADEEQAGADKARRLDDLTDDIWGYACGASRARALTSE